MYLTLYIATSIDGFIARPDGDSSWVSELDLGFEEQIKQKGCIILGHNTYQQFLNELYPVENVTNIVLSNSPSPTMSTTAPENVRFVSSPKEALKQAKQLGHTQALLLGGSMTNAAFFRERLIDEVCMVIHPLILGSGRTMFNNADYESSLQLQSVQQMAGDLIKVWYKVLAK